MTSGKRIEKRLFDPNSVREAILNAFNHQDYTMTTPAVYLFSDRIEIISFGGLAKGQTRELFLKGISLSRNKPLMDILKNFTYAEQTGHGVPDIIKSYGKEVFEFNDLYINVVIPYDMEVAELKSQNIIDSFKEVPDKVSDKLNESQKKVLKEIIENEIKNRKDIAVKLNMSEDGVKKIICQLKDLKVIERVGSNKNGYWKIK
jgi:predicted HTH transcriptional regulator